MAPQQQQDALKKAVEELLEPSPLDDFISCAAPLETDGTLMPRTALLHVRFAEDVPAVEALARFLVGQSINYALSKRKRLLFTTKLGSPTDLSGIADLMRSVQSAFIEFRKKNPKRASEVGEVLAYCVALRFLKAAQVAAKMSLKTSGNMPVHGLDGIHAAYQNDALTVYFLESKLAATANAGSQDYAESIAAFLSNTKQYLREYELVTDLGNFDTLTGEAKEAMLRCFDVMANPAFPRRERSVGVICYSEKTLFQEKLPTSDGPVDAHEKSFASKYLNSLETMQSNALKHLVKKGCDAAKCTVFFVAVPDIDELRKNFYVALGIPPPTSED